MAKRCILFFLYGGLAVTTSISLFANKIAHANNTPTTKIAPILVSAQNEEQYARYFQEDAQEISEEDWKRKSRNSVFSSVPGINISTYGGQGQTQALFLRGASSEQTLVLLDGIILNDPLSPSRGFDFSQIPVSDIDHIEVIKGPQSVLYGSDAIGGVIQIFTKKNSRTARLEAGSYKSLKASLSYEGFQGGYERSSGISAADEKEGNKEKDGYRSYHLGGNKEFSLSEQTLLSFNGQYHNAKVNTDSNGGTAGDSFGTFSLTKKLLLHSMVTHFFSDTLEWSLAGSLHKSKRTDNTIASSYFRSTQWKLNNQLQKQHKNGVLSLGLSYNNEEGLSTDLPQKKQLRSLGFFLQENVSLEKWQATLGARTDWYIGHQQAHTLRTSWSYKLTEQSRVKLSVGSGFKFPSLYQIYSTYGNSQLLPEKSLGGDLGWTFGGEQWRTEIFWYQNQFKNLIEFDASKSKFFNVGRASSRGLEWQISWRHNDWQIKNSLTTTHAINQNTNQPLLRRAKLLNTIDISLRHGKWKGSIQNRYTGKRTDIHPTLYTRQSMPAFFLFSAFLEYKPQLNKELTFFMRAENLLNRKYQQVSGYGTEGASLYAGLELPL